MTKVAAVSARHLVGNAVTSLDDVGRVSAKKSVGACIAGEQVLAVSTVDRVVVGIAVQIVSPRSAVDRLHIRVHVVVFTSLPVVGLAVERDHHGAGPVLMR
jgi:hypothetical protein